MASLWRRLRGTIETVWQIGLGGPKLSNLSGVLDSDSNESWGPVAAYKPSAVTSTTNATITTVLTIALAASTTYKLSANIAAVTTGGASGTAGDSWCGDLVGVFKRVGSASPVAVGVNPAPANVQSDTSVAACTATYTISGNNILVQVTGVSSINIDWQVTAQTLAVT